MVIQKGGMAVMRMGHEARRWRNNQVRGGAIPNQFQEE